MAINAVSGKREARGAGHIAKVRRDFIRDAANIYLMAGFDTISANDSSVFMGWCYLLNDVCGLGVADNGSFRRAILDEIGKSQTERNAWKANRIKWIERTHHPRE